MPEVGHLATRSTAYVGALVAYAEGTRAGVTLWVRHCGHALVRAAAEGEQIADAVRAGRLQ